MASRSRGRQVEGPLGQPHLLCGHLQLLRLPLRVGLGLLLGSSLPISLPRHPGRPSPPELCRRMPGSLLVLLLLRVVLIQPDPFS